MSYDVYWSTEVDEELDGIIDRARNWPPEERRLLRKAIFQVDDILHNSPAPNATVATASAEYVIECWPLRVRYEIRPGQIVKVLAFEEMPPILF